MLDTEALKKAYPYLTELHCHTAPVSRCSRAWVRDAVREYLAAGVHTLTITNHIYAKFFDVTRPEEEAERWLADYDEACRLAEGTELNVLLGAELGFPNLINDYLLYGVEREDMKWILPMLTGTPEDFYRAWRREDRLMLQAHPFRKDMILAPLDAIDGIEVFNLHPNHNSAVGIAARYAKEHGLIISGGSDYHQTERDTALCLIRTRERLQSSHDIVRVLRTRDFLFDISGNLILPQ